MVVAGAANVAVLPKAVVGYGLGEWLPAFEQLLDEARRTGAGRHRPHENIGEKGDNSKIRVLPGGLEGAQELFDRLTKGKGGIDTTPEGRQGKIITLPDGSITGIRPTSKSGPPTIDINVSGTSVKELKFR